MMLRSQPVLSKSLVLLALIPVAISVFTVFHIARKSGYNVHPDEYVHLDAMCYFEGHWWPPDVNSYGIVYSDYGWNRLYDSELVYLIFGKLIGLKGWFENLIDQGEKYDINLTTLGQYFLFSPVVFGALDCGNLIRSFSEYRMLNVWLYLLTLLIMVGLGRKHPWPFIIALLLLCIPQVGYLYSYANSDAWGLSMSLFLFGFVVVRRRTLLESWSDLFILSILTGLVILSKKTFWLSVPTAYLLLGLEMLENLKGEKIEVFKRFWVRLTFLFTLTLLLVAPLKIIYPLTQGSFEQRALKMREERASPGFKPSHITQPGFHLAERGYSVRSVANSLWFKQSAASFYGLFGYMSERLPQWLYALAYSLMLVLATTTYATLALQWNDLPKSERYMILLAPAIILIAILASLYNSWTFDFQPQGRYLFGALIPLGLIEGGLFCYESRYIKIFRLVSWIVLYFSCLFVLWVYVLGNPVLIPY